MATKGSAMISVRDLNRATLARQMLLTREKLKPLAAIERLVAMQAQAARPPFVGLWSRLAGFHREDLHKLVVDGQVVRATFLRATLHLSSRRDYLGLRAALEPVFAKGLAGLGARAKGIDVDDIVALARELFDKGPVRFEAVRDHLKAARPSLDERAMGYAARLHVPLVHVPSGEAWTFAPDAEVILADGLASDAAAATRALVRRYLAAFGPASVTDAQAWSGLGGLKPVFEALRPSLLTFVDDKKRELFDLPDAPRPGDVDAPVRYVPDFDNLVLGHADRRRIVADEHKKQLVTKNLLVRATFLVDGFVAGTWKTERNKGTATLTLEPFIKLAKDVRARLEEEGERLLAFVEPDAKGQVVAFA